MSGLHLEGLERPQEVAPIENETDGYARHLKPIQEGDLSEQDSLDFVPGAEDKSHGHASQSWRSDTQTE